MRRKHGLARGDYGRALHFVGIKVISTDSADFTV